MLDRVNEDLDTGSAHLGCYWRFCRHAAGIAESEDGQDHRYIQPISGLVGRLDAIAAGRAGQGMKSNATLLGSVALGRVTRML